MELIHHYDDQGIYAGSTKPLISPRDGMVLVPASATAEPPPELSAGECARWNGKDWLLMKDPRGHWYNTETRESVQVTDIDADTSKLTRIAPITDFDYWTGTRWETNFTAQEEYNDGIKSDYAKAELNELDIQSIRPLRSIIVALMDKKEPDVMDVVTLATIELGAKTTRGKVKK